MTEAIQNEKRPLGLKFQCTGSKWKGLLSCKHVASLKEKKNVSEGEAENPEGRDKRHREQWTREPLSGTGTGLSLKTIPGLWRRQQVPGWISDDYGAATVIRLPFLPFFSRNSIVVMLFLNYQDKKIMGLWKADDFSFGFRDLWIKRNCTH